MGIEKGIAIGEERGIEKGREEKEFQWIQEMLSDGMSWTQINRITKVDQKSFEKLKEKYHSC